MQSSVVPLTENNISQKFSAESAENRGTEYGRKLIQGDTTQKLILEAASDTMSGQEVTPQCELCFCIKIAHGYIHGGRDSWASPPNVSSYSYSPYLLFTLFYIYSPNPND